jgi:hypothetical protein
MFIELVHGNAFDLSVKTCHTHAAALIQSQDSQGKPVWSWSPVKLAWMVPGWRLALLRASMLKGLPVAASKTSAPASSPSTIHSNLFVNPQMPKQPV